MKAKAAARKRAALKATLERKRQERIERGGSPGAAPKAARQAERRAARQAAWEADKPAGIVRESKARRRNEKRKKLREARDERLGRVEYTPAGKIIHGERCMITYAPDENGRRRRLVIPHEETYGLILAAKLLWDAGYPPGEISEILAASPRTWGGIFSDSETRLRYEAQLLQYAERYDCLNEIYDAALTLLEAGGIDVEQFLAEGEQIQLIAAKAETARR